MSRKPPCQIFTIGEQARVEAVVHAVRIADVDGAPGGAGQRPALQAHFVADQPLHAVGQRIVGRGGRERGELGDRAAAPRLVQRREIVADGVDLRVAQDVLARTAASRVDRAGPSSAPLSATASWSAGARTRAVQVFAARLDLEAMALAAFDHLAIARIGAEQAEQVRAGAHGGRCSARPDGRLRSRAA